MAITSRKITTYVKNIVDLSDQPNKDGLTAAQLKAMFDGRTDEEVKASINGIVDDLVATTDGSSGADQVGATPVGGGTGNTVQEVLEEIDTNAVHKDVDGENITGLKNFIGSFNVVSDNNNLQGAIGAAGDALYLNATDESTSPTKSASLRIEPSDEMNALLFKGGNDPTYKKVWHEGNDGTGSGLDADTLDGKHDADMVHIDGTETITGTKTFSTAPVVPTPTADTNPATKKYADDIASARYTKTDMHTSGQALLHWDNLTNVPNLADAHWKTPVANQAALPVTGNSLGDNRVVLDDGDGKQAVYTCVATTGTYEQQWSKVGDVDWMTEEATRQTQETARVNAEGTESPKSGRVGAELDRVANENARILAEGTADPRTGRIGAELDRVDAENARESAEILRQAHINDKDNPHEVTAAQAGAVPTDAITNTLTETAEGNVLDARQGKVLADLISTNVGDLETLTTTDKSSLVNATNEVKDLVDTNTQFTDVDNVVYSWRFIKSAEGHMQLEYMEVI
jgi:hypothetical protein